MLAVWARGSRRVGRIFIAIVAERRKTTKVMKIAIPPPRGTVLVEKRSLTGRETKPNRPVSFFVRMVKISDKTKEPARRAIANMVSV
jgi:hypothetical protein